MFLISLEVIKEVFGIEIFEDACIMLGDVLDLNEGNN